MRETVRIVATFVLQALGVWTGVGAILLAIERYPENGPILTAVIILLFESVALVMIVGGAQARGKRQSGGYPLDPPDRTSYPKT